MFPGDYKKQTAIALSYVDEALEKEGITKKNIVKVTSYLRNMEEGIKGYSEAWDEWKDVDHLPARTTIEAKMVRPDMLIEIDVIAAFPQK